MFHPATIVVSLYAIGASAQAALRGSSANVTLRGSSRVNGELSDGSIDPGHLQEDDWNSSTNGKPEASRTRWSSGAPAKCQTTYRLDEFAKWAHTWCSPRDGAYMPKKLQGLFWFKDMKLDEVAACFSLGSWDSDNRVLKLDVATSFVFKDSRSGRLLASQTGAYGMYYEFQFGDEGLSAAEISPRGTGIGALNFKVMDSLTTFPLIEMGESGGSGDLWERPSYFGGVHANTYYAWRILDSSMRKEWSRIDQMERQIKEGWDGDLIRYHDDGC